MNGARHRNSAPLLVESTSSLFPECPEDTSDISLAISGTRRFSAPFRGAHRAFVPSGSGCPSMTVGDSCALFLLGERGRSCAQALQLLVLLCEDFRSPHTWLRCSFPSLLPPWHQDKTHLCLLPVCESTSCFFTTFFAFLRFLSSPVNVQ